MTTPVVFDCEIYQNYFLAAFKSTKTGRVVTFERIEGLERPICRLFSVLGFPLREFDRRGLRDVMRNNLTVGFNSRNFDLPLVWMAVAGFSNKMLKRVVDQIIFDGAKPWDIERAYGFTIPETDHIDLIEVAPGKASLKLYYGRLHGRRMQDLPIDPNAVLTPDEIAITRTYCVNDLDATALLLKSLEKPLELRASMGREYRQDLRSKSDAQIAEAVIKKRLEEVTGERPERPVIRPGTKYRYRIPDFVKFLTPQLRSMIDQVREADFVVAGNGKILMPSVLAHAQIELGSSVYRMGIGGLHSSEQNAAHRADENTIIADRDVASHYPAIILNLNLYPKHLGPEFLRIYRDVVERRLKAKKEGNKVVAESLKITINGIFGKFGSRWSALYSPDLLIQVTVTGQLTILMLIERMELAGIPVVSANTDGLVIKCPRCREADMLEIVKQWEKDTGFETEETRYSAVYSRDVNNYIAVKEKGGSKGKGAYTNPWSSDGEPDYRGQLMKNPNNSICVDAVMDRITKGIPVEQTIRGCRDITKFVTVVTVQGGAIKDGEYLGKAIRFYHSTSTDTPILYKNPHPKTGNFKKVSRSDGARPLMQLPDTFPDDVDFQFYIEEANSILEEIGFTPEFRSSIYALVFPCLAAARHA